MSFKSREKKRKAARAVSNAVQQRTPATEARWFLTPVRRHAVCGSCAGRLHWPSDMVYRHKPLVMLCVACADADPGVSYRPSVRWEREELRRRGKELRRRGTAASGPPS